MYNIAILYCNIQWATLIYLLGYKISLPEVFWYPIIFVFNFLFLGLIYLFLEKLGTENLLVN